MGATPIDSTPNSICTAIEEIYSNGKNSVKLRTWETFIALGGLSQLDYDNYSEFLHDQDAFTTCVSFASAIDHLVENESLFSETILYNSTILEILLSNSYALEQIKLRSNLVSLIVSNLTLLQQIANMSNILKSVSATGSSQTVNGIFIKAYLYTGGQFWGYSNGSGQGNSTCKFYLNGTSYSSVSASGTPSSNANHTNFSSSKTSYNDGSVTNIANTIYYTHSKGESKGTSESSSSVTYYYI